MKASYMRLFYYFFLNLLNLFFLSIYTRFFKRRASCCKLVLTLYLVFGNLTYFSLLGEREGNNLPHFCEDFLFFVRIVENDRARSSSSFFIAFFLPPPWCSSIVEMENQLPSLSHTLIFMTFTLHEEIFS